MHRLPKGFDRKYTHAFAMPFSSNKKFTISELHVIILAYILVLLNKSSDTLF